VVLLALDDQQRGTVWIPEIDLGLGEGVEVCVGHLHQSHPGASHVVGVVQVPRLLVVEGVGPSVLELIEREGDRAAPLSGFRSTGPADFNADTGRGRTPRNGPGSMATEAAESPRSAIM
jgi:hypothetical protein